MLRIFLITNHPQEEKKKLRTISLLFIMESILLLKDESGKNLFISKVEANGNAIIKKKLYLKA